MGVEVRKRVVALRRSTHYERDASLLDGREGEGEKGRREKGEGERGKEGETKRRKVENEKEEDSSFYFPSTIHHLLLNCSLPSSRYSHSRPSSSSPI
jgi:hypothetical protein